MKNGKIIVLHVITRFIGGGGDENTLHSARGVALRDSRYQVFLAAGIQSDIAMLHGLDSRVPFILVPHLRRPISPLHDLLALISLVYLCRVMKCDILHTHTAKAGILGRIAGKIAGVPVIVHTLHGSTFHPFIPRSLRFLYRHLEKLAARLCHKIISVSPRLASTYLAAGVGKREQYTTIYSGMSLQRYRRATSPDEALLKALGIRPDEKVVGTICQLEPRKGVSFFLQMAKVVKACIPGCKFLIVGDGYQRKELEALRDKLGLQEDVIFTGYRKDVPKFLSIFNVFVLTSLWEGIPRVLVQAAAAGKPSVAFSVDGVPDIVKDGINGFLVEPKNIEKLASKVIFLLENPDRAKAMGKREKEVIGDKWTIESMVSQTYDLYQSLLSRHIPTYQEQNADLAAEPGSNVPKVSTGS